MSLDHRVLRTAAAFAVMAAATRYFVDSFQTRTQIVAFVVLAAVWAITTRRGGLRGFVINAAAAAIGAIAVRWMIEGLCAGYAQPMCLPI